LCASAENNAVSSYISYDEKYLDKGDCVFIGGKTFVVTYQEKDFYSNDSHNLVLYLKNDEKSNRAYQLFLAACVNKSLGHKYSWGDSISNRKIQKDKVSLPIKNGKIDFEFMESFMSEVEQERIADLEAYLLATGLKDYTLTVEEEQTLEKFEKGKVKFEEFEIQTLFEVSPSKAYAMNDGDILIENGKTPYVSNQSQNNGYIGWSNFTPLNPSNVVTLSDTWQSERTIFYQPTEFIGKSHLQVIKAYNTQFQKFELFFVISSFRKAILEMNYDYGTKFNRGKIKTTKIQLPTNNKQIDYALMRTFILAIQKLVIKDVVLYADRKLDATKTVVNK
jgi:Type I restriction modification DNA specificity domain